MTNRLYFSALILNAVLIAASSTVYAQATSPPAGAASRSEVRMERDEFLKSHRYDDANRDWIPNTPSTGNYSRAEVKIARDQYLSVHRWDDANEDFVPIPDTPRDMNALSREAVKMETMQFVRTHNWDNVNSKWVKKPMRTKR